MISPVFQMLVGQQGDDLIVFKNHGASQETQHEVRGIKNSERGKTIFNLPRTESVSRGDVIQVKGGRDFWRVIDTEDEVEEGTVLVHVEKEGAPRSHTSTPSVIIHNHNSPGSNFNLGSGSIQQSWIQLINQKIDTAAATPDEKQKAKSLLTQISENKLLNTIIGSAVGELTKAALPK